MMFGHNRNGKLYQLFITTLVILVLNRSSVNGVWFGPTYTVPAKGFHQATVVFLHGITEDGLRWSKALQSLGCSGIKWIVPTAPIRLVGPVPLVPMTAWYNVGPSWWMAGPEDTKGIDESVKHAMDLLKGETVKVGIGGFSLGSATTLYATAVYANGSYSDGSPFTTKLTAAVALSGWLPGYSSMWDGKFASPQAKARQALPIMQVHGTFDFIVPFLLGKGSHSAQKRMGFSNMEFKTHNGRGHIYYPGELFEMCKYYKEKFGILF